ncbi:MAG: hypothetical protein ACREEA_01610, partial [Stellaceae bacterium]
PTRPRPAAVPPLPVPSRADNVRTIMARHVGVLRDRDGLTTAIAALAPLAFAAGPQADPALVGLFVAAAALQREESRGSHARTDFPTHSSAGAHRSRLRLADVPRLVEFGHERIAVGT